MNFPPLKTPSPDFAWFQRVLLGRETPSRVPIIELSIDQEIQQAIQESVFRKKWVPYSVETRKAFFQQQVGIYHALGYDYAVAWAEWPAHPPSPSRKTADTADLARDQREWIEESQGLISSWETLERFPWDELVPETEPLDYMAAALPEGMKLFIVCTLFEHVLERLLGFEGLFYLLHDDEELVGEVFRRWGACVHTLYEKTIRLPYVGGILHCDDMGFKTSTLIAPEALRKHLFPWYRKYAALAHEEEKILLFHSCGNLYKDQLIDGLIDDVGIDGFHSFEDVIVPIGEFKKAYGNRVAALGGVDMDKLARLEEKELREYVRRIITDCMPGGRFALGAGNSLANYIPVNNYLAMLDEARRWQA